MMPQGPKLRYWLLVADPTKYRLSEAITALPEDWWQSKGRPFKVGHGVAIWKAKAGGRQRGVVALGKVVAEPMTRPDTTNPFHIDPAFAAANVKRVAIRYVQLPCPLWLGGEHDAMLSSFSVVSARGGTVFNLLAEQWEYLCQNALEDLQNDPSANFDIEELRRRQIHWRIERNRKASQLAKNAHGYVCQACSFDFTKTYGELGASFIEAHHLVPLGSLKEGESRVHRAEDFSVLCANCHRMIHRTDDPSDLKSFRRRLDEWRSRF